MLTLYEVKVTNEGQLSDNNRIYMYVLSRSEIKFDLLEYFWN